MGAGFRKIFFGMTVITFMTTCKQIYNPPAIRSNPGWLVVDGFINTGADSTIITLSRTRNLDSVAPVPELNAKISLTGALSESYSFTGLGNGRYAAVNLNLHYNENYQLKIQTTDGKEYLSDTFPARQTPPIDSLTWRHDSVGVSIYAYAHDPQNATKYYRWNYVETWQYHTYIQTIFDFVNGRVARRPLDSLIYNCWKTFNSSDIGIATTEKLSSDVINQQLIQVVPAASEKISVEYSILVNQYAITADAFAYWQNLKKNTEERGSLFDPQPSQLTGNIHCMNNPNEPVLGYIGASSVQQKRIFISNDDLIYWNYKPYYSECSSSPDAMIGINRSQTYEYLVMPNHLYTLIDSVTGGGYIVAQNYCADCREHGGINQKPPFWQ
ncbi:MAG TPA: DUF4249 domain-containing protein [Puia sp.]|nr:DUF4249 domain-containing protein [Puia sp.]